MTKHTLFVDTPQIQQYGPWVGQYIGQDTNGNILYRWACQNHSCSINCQYRVCIASFFHRNCLKCEFQTINQNYL